MQTGGRGNSFARPTRAHEQVMMGSQSSRPMQVGAVLVVVLGMVPLVIGANILTTASTPTAILLAAALYLLGAALAAAGLAML